jgi:S1-C subfamily serine protease
VASQEQFTPGQPSQPRRGGDRPYFGSIPDFSQAQEGYAISGVSKEGPAEQGGLAAGDVIVRFGDSKIGNLDDFDNALRKYKEGDKVPVVVKRGEQELTLEVELGKPR